MKKINTLDDVIALAEFAHRGQMDKAGLPYIQHPLRVMKSVQAQGALPYVQMAAVLHDVTEDTAFTLGMLLELGVPEPSVEIVRLLDRKESGRGFREQETRLNQLVESWSGLSDEEFKNVMSKFAQKYGPFVTADEFYYSEIRQNDAAKVVKLADIDDNLQSWRLAYLPEKTQNRLRNKYAKAKELLN